MIAQTIAVATVTNKISRLSKSKKGSKRIYPIHSKQTYQKQRNKRKR